MTVSEHVVCDHTRHAQRDYRAGFWMLYDRLSALSYAAANPAGLAPERELEIIRAAGEEALESIEQWLEPIRDGEAGYPTALPCACGSERRERA